MVPDRENIRFNTLRNALYHSARRRTFERWNRSFNFLVVALGTAAVGDLLGAYAIDPRWIGAGVAAIGALQLVLDFGQQARDHQTLQRDYFYLLADIEAQPEANPEQCAAWYSRMIRITADEPPVLRAIDAKAYNDAAAAVEYPEGERLHIPWFHRIFGGAWAFEGHNYAKFSELGWWKRRAEKG